ncbi:helix-turn-helix domain-containing protein [Actinoplanes couchii]|uniref:Helix-turn-helix domain-containing protein n=1 Tax=Actinoplanes couchii TaxID=403638 RepID=A0ABQ3XSV6_9ACTN|nr:hypothetical protein [Actinoplanes couchii]MDR6324074.1 hypothetical protein [Actinoplanes couchii]GID61601.1 hypothetical protein Aco03nite_100050 [Actinoplanes couchii]
MSTGRSAQNDENGFTVGPVEALLRAGITVVCDDTILTAYDLMIQAPPEPAVLICLDSADGDERPAGGPVPADAMTGAQRRARQRSVSGPERRRLTLQAAALYRYGNSIRKIAGALGWSSRFIRNLLADADIGLRCPGRAPQLPSLDSWPAVDLNKLATTANDLYQNGRSLQATLRAGGTSFKTVRRVS